MESGASWGAVCGRVIVIAAGAGVERNHFVLIVVLGDLKTFGV